MQKTEFILGREELVLLVWLLKYPTLPGLGDKPLGDATPGQVKAMLATAERSLGARGWLEIRDSGLLHIQPDLAAMLQICGDPDATIWFSRRQPDGDGDVFHFYLKQDIIVHHDYPKPGLHRLAVLPSPKLLLDHLIQNIPIKGEMELVNYDAQIADSLIIAAKRSAQEAGPVTAAKMLVRNGIEYKFAEALSQAFAQPLGEATLICAGPKIEKPNELIILTTSNGTWLFQSATKDPGVFLQRVRTVSQSHLEDQVANWLNLFTYKPD